MISIKKTIVLKNDRLKKNENDPSLWPSMNLKENFDLSTLGRLCTLCTMFYCWAIY